MEFCTFEAEFHTFEADSSNVQLSDWLRDRIGLKCMKFLTFDSNSTSGFEESDVLKMMRDGVVDPGAPALLIRVPTYQSEALLSAVRREEIS